MEKPTRVEVGQRWGSHRSKADRDSRGYEYLVTTALPGERFEITFTSGGLTDIYSASGILPDVYLGGPTASPLMEAKRSALTGGQIPISCLMCGETKGELEFVCQKCQPGNWLGFMDEWKAGARDFPRRPSTPVAPPAGSSVEQCSIDGITWVECGCRGSYHPKTRRNPLLIAPPKKCSHPECTGSQTCNLCSGDDHGYGCTCKTAPTYRGIGETRALDGTPLTALQAIPCRRSSESIKPVPPFIPSVDEDFWIPEVG